MRSRARKSRIACRCLARGARGERKGLHALAVRTLQDVGDGIDAGGDAGAEGELL